MNSDQKEALIQSLKRTEMMMSSGDTVKVDFGKEDIYKIIPHRPPFALIDSISAIDMKHGFIEAKSHISPSDPIFEGHFPGAPFYPGVMQVEAMGQAGLCLAYFVKNKTTSIGKDSKPVVGLFTRIHNAGFNSAVKPGNDLTIRVKSLEDDDFMGLMSAQVTIGNEIYSHSILEVYYQ